MTVKKKIIAIIMTAAMLIGAAMPAAAYSQREIDGMIAAAQQLEKAHKPSYDLGWFLQQWGTTEDSGPSEPADDSDTEEQPEDADESEDAAEEAKEYVDSYLNAAKTLQNLWRPRWD